MSFATEKDKPNSDRFMLVKLTPSRYIGSDLVLSSGVYSMAWTYNVEKLQRNGVDLTEVSATPTVNDTWYWDGSTLSVKLAAAPSSTNVIVVFYNLFYTSGEYRITTVDPEDDATDEIHWEPRLEAEPAVKQSVRDIINGTLSTALTAIRLINVDNEFQNYLTDNDSFYEKTVKCWLCINGVANIQKAFEGRVKKLGISKDRVTLTTYDIFSLLDQPALMGDTPETAYWSRESGSFASMYPQDSGTPIKMILAPISRYKTKTDAGVVWGAETLDTNTMERATLTSFSATGTQNQVNRTWGLCRTLSDGLTGPNDFSGTAQGETSLANITIYTLTTAQVTTMGCILGDHYKIVSNSITHYGRLVRMSVVASNTELYFETTAATTPAFNTSVTLTAQNVSIILKRSNREVPLFETFDYTLNTTTLSSGNIYHYITLKNNFEGSHLIPGTGSNLSTEGNLDPGFDQLFFRVRPDTSNLGHADVLKLIGDNAGMNTNSASFTAAQTELDINAAFSIPQFDETDFNSYRKYAEEICKSTMGILSANNSFELEYQLLATPSSNTATTEDMYLKDSLAIDIDYQDIVTQLIAYNPHNSSQAAIDAADSPSETVSSAVAEHLHGVKNTVRFRHVLETITDRIQDIFDILSHRRAIYTFKTATDNLDSEIGDDLQLESDQVLGGVGTRDLKIISIDKSADEVVVEATDLLDI